VDETMTAVAGENATVWYVERVGKGQMGKEARDVCESYIVVATQIQKEILFLVNVADFGFGGNGRMVEDTKILWMDQEKHSGRKVVAVKAGVLKEATNSDEKLAVLLISIPAVTVMDYPSVIVAEKTPTANMLISLEVFVIRYPSVILVSS
jgi:hypothetical protein